MSLKKIFAGLFLLFFLNGCVQNTALLGPVYTLATTGNIYQAGLSYGSNQAVKKITGKSPSENIQSLVENKKKKNEYLDKDTGNKIPDETIKLLEIQKDMTIKNLIKIPKLYETENNTLIEASNRANQFLWRMCESYELWCKESGQSEQLLLGITD